VLPKTLERLSYVKKIKRIHSTQGPKEMPPPPPEVENNAKATVCVSADGSWGGFTEKCYSGSQSTYVS
jgi:hypothetical protein